MLARVECCLLLLASCVSVAAFYPATGALNTQPLVLCDSLDADVAALLAATTPAFPGSLAESRCVAINVCDEQTQRGEGVPRGAWLHRGEKALALDGEALAIEAAAAAGEHYNYHSLEFARVPEGVVLEVCEPNFDRLRTHGEHVCAGPGRNVSGACPGADAASTGLVSCLAPLQPDPVFVGGTLGGEAVSVPVADARGSTQLIRYTFAEGWGCFEAADTGPGTTLSQTATPNRVVECGALAHGAYTAECAFACDAGYVPGGATGVECVHVCSSATAQECATGHYATTTCSDVSPPLYQCASCTHQAGQRFLPWSAGTAGQCLYEACPPGTFEAGGACTPCPQHSYTGSAAQTACVACDSGAFTAAAGASACEACFAEAYSGPQPACGEGQRVVRELDEIAVYFNASGAGHAAAFDLYAACAANVACLPCAPGSQEEGGVCEPCALGTYQPNFQQTTCFACGTGLTTQSTGRTLASECVCVEGFD